MDREAGKSGSLNIFTSLGVVFGASKRDRKQGDPKQWEEKVVKEERARNRKI